ncbi:MAG: protein phosphatase 2C domain-containing protein [Planctomycetota bacterium]
MRQRHYGVIVRLERNWGTILVQDGRSLHFSREHFSSRSQREPVKGLPVKLSLVRHPSEAGNWICREVCPLDEEETPARAEGVVLVESPTEWVDGKIQLSSAPHGTASYRRSVLSGPLQEGRHVSCIIAPRKAGEWFALRVEPKKASATAQPPLQVKVAGATRKGKHPSKSVNEDAFLATTLAGGEFWLAAVADGISASKESWWASSFCMELLWRSRELYEKELLDSFERRATSIVGAWMNHIHERFLAERAKLDKYREANATLTFAVGRRGGRRYAYASCGDSRIYDFPPIEGQALAVISDEDLRGQRVSAVGGKHQLLTHIGADRRDWENRIIRERPLPAGSRVLVCTDGVITQRTDPPISFGKKFAALNSLAKARNQQEMQQGVTEALEAIARLNEQDDLTLVMVWP